MRYKRYVLAYKLNVCQIGDKAKIEEQKMEAVCPVDTNEELKVRKIGDQTNTEERKMEGCQLGDELNVKE